jgi:hypothetical protein
MSPRHGLNYRDSVDRGGSRVPQVKRALADVDPADPLHQLDLVIDVVHDDHLLEVPETVAARGGGTGTNEADSRARGNSAGPL